MAHIGKLTALFVKKCKTPGMFADGGNLYLQVESATAKSWIFRYDGRYLGLGSAFVTTLEEARDLAYDCRKLRQQGIDPIEAKRSRKAHAAAASRYSRAHITALHPHSHEKRRSYRR
jgi:hypothetical protein